MAKEYIKRVDLENRLHALCAAQRITAQDAIDIAILPAADVRPVVRGRWIEEFDGFIRSYTCSECGEYALTKEETMNDEVCSNFCPNCGAKMDGGQDDA